MDLLGTFQGGLRAWSEKLVSQRFPIYDAYSTLLQNPTTGAIPDVTVFSARLKIQGLKPNNRLIDDGMGLRVQQ